MITTVILVIFLIATIATFVFAITRKVPADYDRDSSRARNEYGRAKLTRRIGWIVFASVAVVTAAITAFSTITVIKATEVAVPVSFGVPQEPITKSGPTFTAPWVSLETFPTRPLQAILAGDDALNGRVNTITSDFGSEAVDADILWRVEKEDATKLYLVARTGDDKAIQDKFVTPRLREAIGEVYSQTTNQDGLNQWEKVSKEILVKVNEKLDSIGIVVDDVNIREVKADDKTKQSLERVAQQEQMTRIAIEAKNTAQIEAERQLIESTGIKRAAQELAGISPEVADLLCQQSWERTVAEGLKVGQPVYTSPCSSAGASVLAK